jgi:UDP:flavonoid glycosyltransferase YjiC (YdhE family)
MRALNPKSILVILTSRGGGDRPPVVALACGLEDRGHRVAVLCDVETAQYIASTGLPTFTFPQALHGKRGYISRWMMRLQEDGCEQDGDWPNPMHEWADPLMPSSLKVVSEFKPDLIVSSLFAIGLAEQLSAHSGIPWCFVNPSFYLGEHATSDWEDDYFGPFLPRCIRECFLPLVRQADIVLHATDPEFDVQPRQLPRNHHYVGFLLWEPQMEIAEFFQEPGSPWALITLSSVRQEEEVILARSALQALRGRPVRTLLTQPDKDLGHELGALPDNATVAGFVPHTPVLKKSAIVISHAGHGIVSKALRYGVPMVLLPWDRDQPGVAARAERLGVAHVVPRAQANPEEVKRAVTAVFDDPRYRQAAAYHSDRLAKVDSVADACRLLEQ